MVVLVVVVEDVFAVLVLIAGRHGKCHILAQKLVHLAVRVLFYGLEQCIEAGRVDAILTSQGVCVGGQADGWMV